MSSADFKKAEDRVEQAKQDIHWLLAILKDPKTSLKGYRLTKDEKEKLSQECHAALLDIQTVLAQVPPKKRHRKVEHTFQETVKETVENTGAQESVLTTSEKVSVQIESTRKDTAETDLAGAIPPWEDEEKRAPSLPPPPAIPPWED